MSVCSTPFVLASETWAGNPVSRPEAIATTPRAQRCRARAVSIRLPQAIVSWR